MEFRLDGRPDRGDFRDGGLCWNVLRAAARQQPCTTIDLSEARFLRPYSVACLAALGALAKGTTKLLLPEDALCRDHLVRIGLPRWFRSDSERVVDRRATNVIAEQTTDRGSDFASRAIEVLTRELDIGPGVRPALEDHLDEVVLNAMTHADSPIGCVTAGQAFPRNGELELAVVDFGQTIPGHLRMNPKHRELASDADAIIKATEEGVTGTVGQNRFGEPNSGVGLAELRSYCEAGGGEMAIMSGGHWVVFGAGEPAISEFRGGFRGTLINVRFFSGNRLPSGKLGGKIW